MLKYIINRLTTNIHAIKNFHNIALNNDQNKNDIAVKGNMIDENPPENIRYNIEKVGPDCIVGWLFNKDSSDMNRETLTILFDDHYIINYTSWAQRQDVKKAFNINCNSGFLIPIPEKFLDGKTHSIKLQVQHNSQSHLLKRIDKFSQKSQWISNNKSNKKTILFCTHNLRSQGAQNSLLELALGLRRLYNIVPIVYSPSDGPLAKTYKLNGIKVIIDNSYNLEYLTSNIVWENFLTNFSNKLKHLGCDLVIANTLLSYYMIHISNKIGIPNIFIPRESEDVKSFFDCLPEVLKKNAYSSLINASQVVFVAEATRKIWEFIDLNNSFKVIHNSLNTSVLNKSSTYSKTSIRQSYGISENEIVLLSLGTVCPRKGQLDFVESLPEIFKKTSKKIKIFIVGVDLYSEIEESYSSKLIKLIDSYPENIKKNIVLIPETDKQLFTYASEFYMLADIFLFTSRIESFPRVILEALYFGLPIVTTKCFGVAEQCINNYNALYYEEGDIKDLSEKITHLLEDDIKRDKFSEMSKQLFSCMQTYDQMIKNYYNLIEKLLKDKDV